MDFSKLSGNDKLATYGAVASIVGSLLSAAFLGAVSGLLMLAIVFLPQFSPATKLPGSKGSLMLIVGGVAGIGALFGLLALLPALAYLGTLGYGMTWALGLIVAIAGGLLMGWASWKEFQSEGGKFQIGNNPPNP